ncbi:hypothetical protein [Indiicoccus explosivorum]|uniref:hypothetical protein n=1 Tax=Indiicoccus explosivorum TaxID=1917864 RepID=UPI000B436DEF|nr:hypothetical protein [Indiicoccus explosivorum]
MKRLIWIVAAIALAVLLPFIIWFMQPGEELEVVILDKTVPAENYREHHGVTWLLNHFKYTGADGRPYSTADDYFGFVPDEGTESYSVRSLPASLAGTDVIYVADTYGVVAEEPASSGKEAGKETPSQLYGGLDAAEWKAIKEQALDGTALIMEFNSFASPTAGAVREDVTAFLGLAWDGWSGRYFSDLSAEVPDWAITRYENKTGDWAFKGAGFILINDFTGDVVVLSEEAGDIGESGISLAFTDAGQELFGLETSPAYGYWFDIHTALAGTDVLAEYEWDLQEGGSAKLDAAGIPADFPAVVRKTGDTSDRYYFAGDYADIPEVPPIHAAAGFAAVRSLFTSGDTDSFYWKTYVPVMKKILSSAGRTAADTPDTEHAAAPLPSVQGIEFPAKIAEDDFAVYRNGGWEEITIKGVNIGMGKPGAFPGEAAITYDEYLRWFRMIGELNANAIRVYTLHPPAFYEALAAYNAEAEQPLYVFHGVWADEAPLEETIDAFTPEITETFQEEMKKVADAVHGNAVIAPEPGHASGTYDADISRYVIGWVIGIEWYPGMVAAMDEKYPDLADYDGEFIYTENGRPMEIWLAQQLDFLAKHEIAEYGTMRPYSFTNWVTTDNLEQPAEPADMEDMATVDPNHLHAKGVVEEVGLFTSYHVYPYYPEFLNIEERYTEFIDHRGERNNYAGYLNDLNASHDMPILIAEFGVPASRGQTHRNPFGWNQGFLSEKEQGEIAARLFEDIVQEDLLGGLLFTWQDEWFKRTWNTLDYDNPDRRPFWSNAQTNEQQFGLLSFDRHKIGVDGEDDWETEPVLSDSEALLRNVSVTHDERYLYIKAELAEAGDAFWDGHDFRLYFSMRDGAGVPVEIAPGKEFAADFRLTVDGSDEARLEVAGDYDKFYYQYAQQLRMIPEAEGDIADRFHPIRLALNKRYTRPDTGETVPFEAYETGVLKFGIGDPEHPDYDSLADYYFSEETGILELRIPWLMLNARDPSQLEFVGDLQEDGITASMKIDGIGLAAIVTDEKGEVAEAMAGAPVLYSWEPWNLPETEERLKKSYGILQELFGEIK